MSTRVRLLFNFPQYRVMAQSIVTMTLGVCSIGAAIFGFWVKVWGYYLYTGAWAGGVCVLAGALGIHASRFKGVCTVKLFMAMAYFAFLASLAQLILSIGGIINTSNFYMHEEIKANEGTTQLIHGLLIGFGTFQSILSFICAVICSRLLCCFKPNQMKTSTTGNKRSIARNDSRTSTSSHRPLVSGERGRRSKRKKEGQNGNFQQIPSTADSGNRPIIRGRRYGNVPVVGSNVVELMEKQDKLKLLPVNYNENRSNHNLDIEMNTFRSPRDRDINYQSSNNYNSESRRIQDREHQIDCNLGNTRTVNNILYADGVESPDGQTTGLKSFPSNSSAKDVQGTRIHRIPSNSSYAHSFIPIENAVEEPLSIEEDEELPPYEEAIKEDKEAQCFHVDDVISNCFEPPNLQPSIENVSNEVQTTGPPSLNSGNNCDLNTYSVFNGRVSPFLDSNIPFDPQGVSYCSIKGNNGHVVSSDTVKISSMERKSHDEQRGMYQSIPSARMRDSEDKLMKNELKGLSDSVESSPDFFSRRDPRRISVSSTMSLPVGYAPPKPPRLFHKDYTSLKTFVSSDSLSTLISPSSMDKSLDSVRSKTLSPRNSLVSKQRDERGSAPTIFDNRKSVSKSSNSENTVFRYDMDIILPLSVKTNECKPREDSLKASVPYAHSSPKLKGWDELIKHKSPGISPIVVPDKVKHDNRGGILSHKASNNSQDPSDKDNSLSLKPYLIKSSEEHGEYAKRKHLSDAIVNQTGAGGFTFSESEFSISYGGNELDTGSSRQNSQVGRPERSKSYPRMKSKPALARKESSGDEHKGSDRPSLSVLERKLPLPSSFMSSSCAPVLSVWKGSENCDPVIDASTQFITAVNYTERNPSSGDVSFGLSSHNSGQNFNEETGTAGNSSAAPARSDTASSDKPLLQQIDNSSQSNTVTSHTRSPTTPGKPIYSILL
ncbi:hypothetical protein FSP39_022275 [Pinctada imbricata]|uniref:Uncharacterized protein n=1 Tax=Pinctada imbricata TaxID=66713 RepID=A0AA88Y940_PINIB|nr:hypothetical protein FSP39_022275 [Pinctada imbricata]